MIRIRAKNKTEAIKKTKLFIRKTMGQPLKNFIIQIPDKPNPRFSINKTKLFTVYVINKERRARIRQILNKKRR